MGQSQVASGDYLATHRVTSFAVVLQVPFDLMYDMAGIDRVGTTGRTILFRNGVEGLALWATTGAHVCG